MELIEHDELPHGRRAATLLQKQRASTATDGRGGSVALEAWDGKAFALSEQLKSKNWDIEQKEGKAATRTNRALKN